MKPESRYHPKSIYSSGSAPKGWVDEYRYVKYIREDVVHKFLQDIVESVTDIPSMEKVFSNFSKLVNNND